MSASQTKSGHIFATPQTLTPYAPVDAKLSRATKLLLQSMVIHRYVLNIKLVLLWPSTFATLTSTMSGFISMDAIHQPDITTKFDHLLASIPISRTNDIEDVINPLMTEPDCYYYIHACLSIFL